MDDGRTKVITTQCGNLGIFLLPICILRETKSVGFHSVEKYHKTRSLFLRKNQHFFRQINGFTKEVTKELISRKFFERDRVF